MYKYADRVPILVLKLSKKKPIEIFEAILNSLSIDSFKHISKIASEISSHSKTVRTYVEIIEFLQSQPRIVIERVQNKLLIKKEKDEENEE